MRFCWVMSSLLLLDVFVVRCCCPLSLLLLSVAVMVCCCVLLRCGACVLLLFGDGAVVSVFSACC